MSTETKLSVNSRSSEDTQAIGEKVGQKLKGGEVIELVGDVGAGKTEFVRGLARGINSPDQVMSPTFTISRIYKGEATKKFPQINHFDFYRLAEAGLMNETLSEVIGQPDQAVVVEWSDVVESVMPVDRLTINLTSTSETDRELRFTAGDKHKHLLEGLDS